MAFVNLHRCFVAISKNEETNLDSGRTWSRKITGGPDWSNLLDFRRVVLLAEASSGKTEEFRYQAGELVAQGKAAFFVRIEDLADDGFEAALCSIDVATFEHWRQGDHDEEGWFFLDSVDEARLNHKSLERALRHFERELGKGLERARIYVSCRVSDWKGQEDRTAVERLLPVWKKSTPPALHDEDKALLAPIFNKKHQSFASRAEEEPKRELDALLVVQLVPLNAEQRHTLATASGVTNPDEFIGAIERNGLEALAERPGDLLDLAEYWKEKGRFGSFVEMTEHGVALKLAERDKFRPDNKDLTSEKARQGAERIAAALTLAKSFTLRAPGHDPDPTLAAGALDPVVVLDDWTDAERNALLRRGIFAPSTYGRIRFHHRGTQEYLMASWLKRLLNIGCPQNEVWNLLFADLYGVETLVPSLHAPAGWLAQYYPNIREEIIRREPLVLLRHGDPRSLPLGAKESLLLTYASRHAIGEISNDSLDHRALWMFATPELSNAIRQAWSINDRVDFRIDLLRLIREGEIEECADLARQAVLDGKGYDYLRVVALEALLACGDVKGLVKASRWIRNHSGTSSERLGSGFARILFPQYLTVDQLLDVISKVLPPKRGSSGGFSSFIDSLWRDCPDLERERFLEGIANLVLMPPFKDHHKRISARHRELAASLAPIAIEAASKLSNIETSDGFLRLLMVLERVELNGLEENKKKFLQELVSGNPRLQRRLFWADVEEKRENNTKGDGRLIRFWEVWFSGGTLWQFGFSDVVWLYEDILERPSVSDKRIALSAIYSMLAREGTLESELSRLLILIAGTPELEQDLEEYLKPVVDHDEEYRQQSELYRIKREKEEVANKASWIKFRDELKTDPSVLCDPVRLSSWSAGAVRLNDLSRWLHGKTNKDYNEASLQWRLLEEGFNRAIAEGYRDGMKILWRVTPPERPKHKKGGSAIVKFTTILSFSGIGVEASEDLNWASKLTPAEAVRAVQHACLSEQGYPNWIEELVDQHLSSFSRYYVTI